MPTHYLHYSKTFAYDSKGNLHWSKGVTVRGAPITQTLLKQAIWDAKQKRKRLTRSAKKALGRRLTKEELVALQK